MRSAVQQTDTADRPGHGDLTEARGAGYPPVRVGRIAIVLLFLYGMFSLLDRQIIALLGVAIQKDLGISDTQLGLLQGMGFALVYCVAGLLVGWAVDRHSRRLVIFLGVTIWSLMCMASGFAESYGQLFAARMGIGFGEAALIPATYSMLRDMFPQHRLATATGIVHMGSPLGVALSFALGGNVITMLDDPASVLAPLNAWFRPWQSAFILVSLPGLILAPFIFLIGEPARRIAPGIVMSPMGAFLRKNRRLMIAHILGISFATMGFFALYAWTPVYLSRAFAWSPARIGNWLAVMLGIAPMIGSFLAGMVVDRLYSRGQQDAVYRVLLASLPLSVMATTAAFLVPSGTLAVLLLGVAGLCGGALAVCSGTALQLMVPTEIRGRVTALYMLTMTLTIAFGPLFVGIANDRLFKSSAMLPLSVIALVWLSTLVAAICFCLARAPFRARVAASTALANVP